jgi:HEAT repeat protein
VRLRTATPDCEIDAGGMPVVWLENVTPDDSVGWLQKIVTGTPTAAAKGLPDEALAAISFHNAPSADRVLISIARDNPSARVKGRALFWIAQRAGDQAARTIGDAIDRDPDTEVKKKAVFALSQLPKDEGVPKLIEVARTNNNPAVRRQAMFWLGQSNDPRALKFFQEILLR